MGYIYIYYGTGGGKTTNALGLALRSVGQKKKVVIIQFMKWWKKTGEYQIRDKLQPYYAIYQFGKTGWMKLGKGEKDIQAGDICLPLRTVEDTDRKLARKALAFAEKTLTEDKPDLLILDEICLATHFGLLSADEVLGLLDKSPAKTSIVMTGRYAPKVLIDGQIS